MANMTFGVNIIPKANANVALGNSDNPWSIVSPNLTGTPTAPTANSGTNTTQIATTAFVQGELASYATIADTVLTTTLSRGRNSNSSIGTGSFAFGANVIASGSYSHAEGGNTIAKSTFSHAEGYGTISIGDCCHVSGMLNRPIFPSGTSVISFQSFNEWDENGHDYSAGDYVKYTDPNTSNVTGYICIRSHTSSSSKAPYLNDSTSSEYWAYLSTVGSYVAEVVGWGTLNGLDSERKNIRILTENGDEKLKGTLYVGCNDDSTGGVEVATQSDISAKLDKSGGTMTGNLTMSSGTNIEKTVTSGINYIQSFADGNAVVQLNKSAGSVWHPIITTRTAGGGGWAIGNYNDEVLKFVYGTQANISTMSNITNIINLPVAEGTIALTKNVISNITRSGTTFTATRGDGTTFTFTQQDTSYPTAITNITRSGTTFTATRANGTTFTFTQQDNNSWRGYQIKEYSHAYTVSANAAVKITGTDFGVSTPSGYTPVAITSFNSGAGSGVVIPTLIDPTTSAGGTIMMLRNTASSSQSFTAKIKILYLQT